MIKRVCKECEEQISFAKTWGYANLCAICDEQVYEARHRGVLVADGKTDYHFQIVRNPSEYQANMIRSAGLAHDPRTQLKSINKVSK
jgi:hypothetical protein